MNALENTEKKFIKDLMKKLESKMPGIRKKVEVYESRLKSGTLVTNPSPSPQFNG